MKLEEFTPDIAKKVMTLWKRNLGFFGRENRSSLRYPEIFSSLVQDPERWVTGRYEDRIGSRYTDDSKLYISYIDRKLEISCYVQAHTIMDKEKRREAKEAEKAFNLAVKEV